MNLYLFNPKFKDMKFTFSVQQVTILIDCLCYAYEVFYSGNYREKFIISILAKFVGPIKSKKLMIAMGLILTSELNLILTVANSLPQEETSQKRVTLK